MGPEVLGATMLALLTLAARRADDPMDPGWPNVLTALVIVVVLGSVIVSVVVWRRAKASLSDGRRRRQ